MFVNLTGEVLNEANYIVFFTELATAINIFVEKKVFCAVHQTQHVQSNLNSLNQFKEILLYLMATSVKIKNKNLRYCRYNIFCSQWFTYFKHYSL